MARKSRKNVGVIGLGIIGSRVAGGLRSAGWQVYVWNRSPKAAPNFLGSAAEVAEACEIIQLFVPDSTALLEVIEAMGAALTPRHIVLCHATVGPEAVLDAARLVHSFGAEFLDAPFTGSKLAAEKGHLIYYIGGEDPVFLRAKPVLESSSKAIVRIGKIGHASTIKVVTNMISAVTVQTLAEALAIVQRAGLDPEILAAALENNACRSGVIELKLPKMIHADYEPHFALKHMFKDVQLGIQIANALKLEIPATAVTAGVLYGALQDGSGDLDFAAIYRAYAREVDDLTDDFPESLPENERPALEPPSSTDSAESESDDEDSSQAASSGKSETRETSQNREDEKLRSAEKLPPGSESEAASSLAPEFHEPEILGAHETLPQKSAEDSRPPGLLKRWFKSGAERPS